MYRPREKELATRVVELGESGDASAVGELLELSRTESAQVRRLSASALGKLATFAADERIVPRLSELLHDDHPQVRAVCHQGANPVWASLSARTA